MRPATVGVLGLCVVVGAAFDAMAHSRVDGVGGTVFGLAATIGLVVSGRLRSRTAGAMAGLAAPFALLLTVRTSWWVVALCAASGTFLLVGAVGTGTWGELVRTSATDLGARIGRLVLSALYAPGYLLRAVATILPGEDRRRALAPALRGLGLAFPLVVVVGALLASADAVFASFLRLPVSFDGLARHLPIAVLGAIGMAALLREASTPADAPAPTRDRRLGSVEATVVLGGLAGVLGLFAFAQVLTAMGGADVILATAGLTRADYARTGFFQLVAVSVIVGIVLLALRALVRPEAGRPARRFTVLAEVAVLLTLVLVGVAVVRMKLYEEAFGLTGLRLAVLVGEAWIAVVFVLIGVAVARSSWSVNWLLPAVVGSALLAVIVTTALDPDAVVARSNLDHHARTGVLDVPYLTSLSDDAVPVVVAGLDPLPPDVRAQVVRGLCASRRPGSPGTPGGDGAPTGPLWWNASSSAAAEARRRVCPS